MATRRAVANGNWSATGTWNGGAVPTDGDTVYANGFNVTLDVDVNIGGANNPTVNTGSLVSGQWYEIVNVGGQNWVTLGAASNTVGTVFQSTGTGTAGNLGTARALATLTSATNTAAGATTGGGGFAMPTIRAMTADLRAGTTPCLNVTATTGTLALLGIRAVGGTSTAAYGINCSANIDVSSCTFTGGGSVSHAIQFTGVVANITGSSVFIAGSSSGGFSFNNASAGTVNILVPCTFVANSAGNCNVFNNALAGTVNISASCIFNGGSGSASVSFNNNSTGTVNFSAPCTFNGGNATGCVAFINNSTGSVTITNGTFTASAFANAINISTPGADARLSGDFLDHWSGWKAVTGSKWRLGTSPTLGQHRFALAGTTDSYFSMYGADNGSFGNPIAANVRSGVSYGGGNLTGTCAVPAAGSVALGVPVDATTGTAVLSVANVQSALTAQGLTTARAGALDNLDATVSSRLAPNGTLATVTTLTNAPTVPSAAAIADEVWNRQTSAITATNSIGERVKNTATTAIVGNLLAQANS